MHGVRSVKQIFYCLFFFVFSTFLHGMNNDTKQPVKSNLRFSIGDYFDILIRGLEEEHWWKNHPYKRYTKSDFHHYDEGLRRRSEPSSFYSKIRSRKRSSYLSSKK